MGNAIHCRKSENLTAVFIHERRLPMSNEHKCTYYIANHKCSKHSIEHSWLALAGCVHGRHTESPFLSIDYAYTLRPDIIQETYTRNRHKHAALFWKPQARQSRLAMPREIKCYHFLRKARVQRVFVKLVPTKIQSKTAIITITTAKENMKKYCILPLMSWL